MESRAIKRNFKAFLTILVAMCGSVLFGLNAAEAARSGTQGSTVASFTSPSPSSEVNGTILIGVTASTNAGVTVSEWCFTRDGSDLNRGEPLNITVGGQPFVASSFSGCVLSTATDKSSATITFDTRILSDGNHTFTARAYDSNNQLSNIASITIRSLNYQTQTNTPIPMLSGTPTVGSSFGVSTGNWDTGVSLEYKWYADEVLIPGATSATFTPGEEQLGRMLSVSVTGTKPGYQPVTKTSVKSSVVVASGPRTGETAGTLISAFYATYGSGTYRSASLIEIEYPTQFVCTGSFSCNVPVRYRYVRTTGFNWSWDFRLTDSSTNEQLATFFTSNTSNWQSVNLYVNNLTKNRNLTFNFYNLSSSETGTVLRPGYFRFIAADTPEVSNLAPVWQPYVLKVFPVQTIRAVQKFKLLQYALPSEILVVSDCFTISAFVATYNLDTGQANDPVSSMGTDFSIRVTDSISAEIAKIEIVGSNNEWTSKAPNRVIEIPLCGISTKLGTSQIFTITVSYGHSAFGIIQTGSQTANIRVAGGLRWTKINCYFGTKGVVDGLVIDAYKPECPVGWKQTKAPVVNGKVTIKSINCLKTGTIFVRTISDPIPVCPAGFKETKLPVKNGKLASSTIICAKGIVTKKITGILPKCPAGYIKK